MLLIPDKTLNDLKKNEKKYRKRHILYFPIKDFLISLRDILKTKPLLLILAHRG